MINEVSHNQAQMILKLLRSSWITFSLPDSILRSRLSFQPLSLSAITANPKTPAVGIINSPCFYACLAVANPRAVIVQSLPKYAQMKSFMLINLRTLRCKDHHHTHPVSVESQGHSVSALVHSYMLECYQPHVVPSNVRNGVWSVRH